MQETQMKAFLREAHEKITAQAAMLQRLTASPLVYATVLTAGSKAVKVEHEWKVGDTVTLEGGQTTTIEQLNNGQMLIELPTTREEWVNETGIVSPRPFNPGDNVTLQTGRTAVVLHEDPSDRGWHRIKWSTTEQSWVPTSSVPSKETTEEMHPYVVVIFEGKFLEVESLAAITSTLIRGLRWVKLLAKTSTLFTLHSPKNNCAWSSARFKSSKLLVLNFHWHDKSRAITFHHRCYTA